MQSVSYIPPTYEEKNPISSPTDSKALPWVAWEGERRARIDASNESINRVKEQTPLSDVGFMGQLSHRFTTLSTQVSAVIENLSVAGGDHVFDLITNKALKNYGAEFPEYANSEQLYSEFATDVISNGIVYPAKIFISEHHICLSFNNRDQLKVRVRIPLELTLASVKASTLAREKYHLPPHIVDWDDTQNATCDAVKVYTTDKNCHTFFNFNATLRSKVNNYMAKYPPAVIFHNVLMYALDNLKN